MGDWRSEAVILYFTEYDGLVSTTRAQCEYSAGIWDEERYQTEMEAVTTQFSQLSRHLLSLINWFREYNQNEVATILETVQLKEKEKLQLVCGVSGHGRR